MTTFQKGVLVNKNRNCCSIHSEMFVLSPMRLAKLYKKLLHHVLMYSQRQDVSYLLAEKNTKPPYSTALYARIKDIELMEKLTAKLYDKLESHNHVWEL